MNKYLSAYLPWLKYFGASLLEFFLPRMCLFCGVPVGETAVVAVCPECEARIEWVASPLCTCCGRVFEVREGPDASAATARPAAALGPGPVHEGLRGAGRYGDHPFQVHPPDRLAAAPAELAEAPGLSGIGDCGRPVAPVPLHPTD